MAKKKITHIIKLQIKGAAATPGPPVGPALGGKVPKPMDFCTQFNARTQDRKGELLPVVISVYEDKSFDFIIKTPPTATLIMKVAQITKGSPEPNRQKVGTITAAQVAEVAALKHQDTNAFSKEAVHRLVAGTARSMGVTVL